MSLYTIDCCLVLDNEGKRIAAKYYQNSPTTLKTQHAFEKTLHNKTRGAYAEIVMLDKQIAVYKNVGDTTLYVLGGHEGNELVLAGALETILESLDTLLRGHVSKRALLENYDYLLLVIDEIIDKGVLMETDAQAVATRCSMSDRPATLTPLHEQTLAQILDTAKDQ